MKPMSKYIYTVKVTLADGTKASHTFERLGADGELGKKGIRQKVNKVFGREAAICAVMVEVAMIDTKGAKNPMVAGHWPIVHEGRKLMAWCLPKEVPDALAAGWERKSRYCFTQKERKELKYWRDL